MTEPSEVLINVPSWQEGAQMKISLLASSFSRLLGSDPNDGSNVGSLVILT